MGTSNIIKADILVGIDVTVVDYKDGFKQFRRDSITFTDGKEDFYINKRPCYDMQEQKIATFIEYFQFQVTQMLRQDILSCDAKWICVEDDIPSDHFYSKQFPYVLWTIIKDGCDRKVRGSIWLKER